MELTELRRMWLKQVLKGFVEQLPEVYWMIGADVAVKFARILASKESTVFENLEEAYQFGAAIGREFIGGENR